jgi:hypothetical protein
VFKGPLGGLVWFKVKGRRVLSRGVRPLEDMVRQATPARAPVLATQARDSFVESVTETGKSPSVETGLPRGVSWVGSVGEMLNIDRVFEPGFTATKDCCG